MKIRAYLPDAIIDLQGRWLGPATVDGQTTLLVLLSRDHPLLGKLARRGQLALLAPISYVIDQESGEELFQPRAWLAGMDAWAVTWLAENPSWPAEIALEIP